MNNPGERSFEPLKSPYKTNVLSLHCFIHGVSRCVDFEKVFFKWVVTVIG